MAIAALIVAVLALSVSAGSFAYVRRNTHVAEAADRRAREPVLTFAVRSGNADETRPLFTVRNDGPQDLDSIQIFRPRHPNGVRYPLAMLGGDFADDAIEAGPLALGDDAQFVLARDATAPHALRVRVICRSGKAEWHSSHELPMPRPPQLF
jgi:hypothetical protein